MLGEFEGREQRLQRRLARLRRRKAHILFDGTPGQQARFLKDHAEPAVCRQLDLAFEILVEPDNDAQQRRLAASRGADDGGDFPAPSAIETGPSTRDRAPEAPRYDLPLMFTSSRPGPPAGNMSFKRLHQECFDGEHHHNEGQSIGQDALHVE